MSAPAALWLVRLALQRGLAAIYLVALVGALLEFRPLLGERGLLPVPESLERARFLEAPSLFRLHYSDRFFSVVATAGVALAAAALLGLTDAGPLWLSFAAWFALWAIYLSILNVGQRFYGFGWESMLVEAGFFAAFLGPARLAPSAVPLLLLRWMLFRVELGAGLIKLRHDPCWRALTCLYYHYETQPLPNPASWHFHRLPKALHRGSVLFSHFVQLVVPFAFFAPQPVAAAAGGLAIFHQLLLIVSGNYSWLNWLTVVLGLSTLSDSVLRHVLPFALPAAPALHAWPAFYAPLGWALVGVTAALSVKPTLNLFSRDQAMNMSYNALHLVNTYGAFGSVSKVRKEVVLEGSEADDPADAGAWREYDFKGKPGDVRRRPPQVAPYHLRLDWMMWFLPFSVYGAAPDLYETWFVRLVGKLLAAQPDVLRLLRRDPFAGRRPRYVRARLFRYEFTSRRERRETGAWWRRTELGEYLPPMSADDVERLELSR
ncbi:MAG TPA: lipase maturation factor family protein [Polyangia bacterium]|nr:lipase maturation factor family protein [Polyangia bacterium]